MPFHVSTNAETLQTIEHLFIVQNFRQAVQIKLSIYFMNIFYQLKKTDTSFTNIWLQKVNSKKKLKIFW